MPLANTLDVARSSLAVLSDQSAVVSRNVAHAGVAGATRKVVQLTTEPGNAPRVAGIVRGLPEAIQSRVLSARSDVARESAIVSGLAELRAESEATSGIGARIGALGSALQTYAAQPADFNLASVALSAAQDVVGALHAGAAAATRVREKAQADIVATVTDLNAQLSRLVELDRIVTSGMRSGLDVTDDLDERDRVVGLIAEQIGSSVIYRSDSGVSLFTDSGIPLYDGTVRQVALKNEPLLPGQPGGTLVVDGLQASGAAAIMGIGSGRLAGLFELRDGVAVSFGAQHDDIAGLLIRAFAESDQGAPASLPDAPGLFRGAGSTSVPGVAILSNGLAASIEIAPGVLPSEGGDIFKLRDGGISGAAYSYNIDDQSGFSSRLQQLVDALSAQMQSAPEAALPPTGSINEMAASSSGWLEQMRKTHSEKSDYASTLLDRASSALNDVAGINIDQQITELLELQRSYQASTKLISAVDSMFGALMQAI